MLRSLAHSENDVVTLVTLLLLPYNPTIAVVRYYLSVGKVSMALYDRSGELRIGASKDLPTITQMDVLRTALPLICLLTLSYYSVVPYAHGTGSKTLGLICRAFEMAKASPYIDSFLTSICCRNVRVCCQNGRVVSRRYPT